MTLKVPKFVVPGQPIVPILSSGSQAKIHYEAGKNCRLQVIKFNGTNVPCIISSVLGKVEIKKHEEIQSDEDEKIQKEKEQEQEVKPKEYEVYKVNVINKNEPSFNDSKVSTPIVPAPTKFSISTPSEHDIVLARVSKITNSRVHVEILNIESSDKHLETTVKSLLLTNLIPAETGETFRGIIRSQDIRSTNRDSVQTWKCYQPGDIVRAEVISLGDGVNYYLSTARNELGVLLARSDDGELLHAIDWEKMIGLQSGTIEARKCANPF